MAHLVLISYGRKSMPAPAVVVLQELFGVNADIRKTCDELPAKMTQMFAEQSCSNRSWKPSA